jgi:hypothetical protein
VTYALAVVIYVLLGLYRWRIDRRSIDPEGLVGVAAWTLILGTLANLFLAIMFYR